MVEPEAEDHTEWSTNGFSNITNGGVSVSDGKLEDVQEALVWTRN
jgi:hypothetical protein